MICFQIEEVQAFTIDMAIANVGGQAGLWLGASVVTVIQALYFLLLGIYHKIANISTQVVPLMKKKTSGKIYEHSMRSDDSFKKVQMKFFFPSILIKLHYFFSFFRKGEKERVYRDSARFTAYDNICSNYI